VSRAAFPYLLQPAVSACKRVSHRDQLHMDQARLPLPGLPDCCHPGWGLDSFPCWPESAGAGDARARPRSNGGSPTRARLLRPVQIARCPTKPRVFLEGDLAQFLASGDYVVNILPSTPRTVGLLGGGVLAHCTVRGARPSLPQLNPSTCLRILSRLHLLCGAVLTAAPARAHQRGTRRCGG
jgi:hypothetical protein